MHGSIRQIVLFDVADEIRLDALRAALDISTPEPGPSFVRPGPDYVRFERPPVVEPLQIDRFEARVKYYDYGVVSVEFDQRFSLDWSELIEYSAGVLSDPLVEQRARDLLKPRLERARVAAVNPYQVWLDEDYVIINVIPESSAGNAADLLAVHGREIAQIVRGETRPLSATEYQEILAASISYYPNDLLVVGWSAAFVFDNPAAAGPTFQLLEYANTQLLEFRHYDELLTGVLAGVYRSIDRGTGVWRRWGLAGEAESLNTVRLDVIEIAERIETSIKFLSDMFYARMYRLAAARVGVPDYRRLVDQKLQTAGELYEFMVDRFDRGRGFFLEVVVVIILLIEIVFLFRGKG
ncbi:MAG TPA: hypothetical protein VHY84_27960 [Bryobacteraceae bacterium]|jgi:hypothetical protein|nr:hypothetical protein [Bryobacteraceae bacterium]